MISKVLSSKKLKEKPFFSSAISRGLLLSDFKRYWWVSFLYSVALLVVIPLQTLLQGAPLPGESWRRETLSRILDFDLNTNGLQMILLLGVPVALAAMLFSYLQASRSTTTAHALPISRTTHFITHSLAGIIMLAIPALLTGTVMFFAVSTSFLGQYITVSDIMQWITLYAVFTFFLFSSTVFAGMFTGNSIAQVIFTYILNVLPAGLYIIVQYSLDSLLYGYSRNYIIGWMNKFLPIINLFSRDRFLYRYNNPLGNINNHFDGYTLVGYLVIAAVLLVTSLFFYKRRKLESAGDIVTFRFAKPLFKYGVTTCTMLLCGMYFAYVSYNKSVIMIMGYLVGSFVGYVVAEMLLQKSFKIFGSYKGYIAFIVIAAVIYATLSLDLIGYSGRVPDISQVESVYLGGMSYDLQTAEKAESENVDPDSPEQYIKNFTFRSEELKRSIIELHKYMIPVKNSQAELQLSQYVIGYRLKNGSRLIREYDVNEKMARELIKPIYEAPEYKQGLFPITGRNPEEIVDIRFEDQLYSGAQVTLSEPSEVKAFIEVLKRQVEVYSYDDIKRGGKTISSAEITYQNSQEDAYNYYAIRKIDKLIIQWLKDKGYYEKVVLTSDKVNKMTLEYQYSGGGRPQKIEVTDRKQIDKLFELEFDDIYNAKEEQVQVMFHTNRSARGYYYPKKVLLEAGFGEYITKLDQMK